MFVYSQERTDKHSDPLSGPWFRQMVLFCMLMFTKTIPVIIGLCLYRGPVYTVPNSTTVIQLGCRIQKPAFLSLNFFKKKMQVSWPKIISFSDDGIITYCLHYCLVFLGEGMIYKLGRRSEGRSGRRDISRVSYSYVVLSVLWLFSLLGDFWYTDTT